MRNSVAATITFIVALICGPLCHAKCVPGGLASPAPQDPVVRVLAAQKACPKDVVEFIDALKRSGARLEPTMVNFGGFHDLESGSFFIFEIVSNDGAQSPDLSIRRGDLLLGILPTSSEVKNWSPSNPRPNW